MMLGLSAIPDTQRAYVCITPWGGLMCGPEGSDNDAVTGLIKSMGCVPRDRVTIVIPGEDRITPIVVTNDIVKRLTGYEFCSDKAATVETKMPTSLLIAAAAFAGFLLLGGK